MKIGMVGLGRMGGNMAHRLYDRGHQVVGYDVDTQKAHDVAQHLESSAESLGELAKQLPTPRIVWLMVPAGDITDKTIDTLASYLEPGDILVDGGNSYYMDSVRHAQELSRKGINFLDIGVSGGIWGLKEGYCLMVGGDENTFKQVEPILKSLAPEDGFAYVGPSGAGHFSKMVHNGIEYGVLEALGEGFEMLKVSDYNFDLHQLAELWQHGSVVRSWLLDLTEQALREDPKLASIKGYIDDSGEGRWMVQEAIKSAIPLPAITDALFARFRSRQEDSFKAKLIAALRNEFGGHPITTESGDNSDIAAA